MPNKIQLIIAMSGLGNRFLNAGYTDPKPLIEIDGFPMVKQVIDLFPGVTDISFICNTKHLRETNMRSLLKKMVPNCRIFEIPVHKKGPVYAVAQIAKAIDDDKEVIVSYCDFGAKWDFPRFLKVVREGNFDGSIPSNIGFHPHMLGTDLYASLRMEGEQVVEVKEKGNFTNNRLKEYASCGIYYYRSGRMVKRYFQQLMDEDININGEYFCSLVYNLMIRDGLKVGAFEIDNYIMLGTPYDVETYRNWSRYFTNISQPRKPQSDTMNTTLLVPMAGNGQRFVNEGYRVPKPMLDVDGEPMALKAFSCLPNTTEQVFVCQQSHLMQSDLEERLSMRYPKGQIVRLGGVTKGQACSCEMGIRMAGVDFNNPLLITACDYGLFYDEAKYQKLLQDESVDVIVWGFKNSPAARLNPDMFAWIEADKDDTIKSVRCKRAPSTDPFFTPAICGTFFYRRTNDFLRGLQGLYISGATVNDEYYVDSVINQNVQDGLRVKLFLLDSYVCWGTPNDYKVYKYWLDYFTQYKLSPFKKPIWEKPLPL